MNAPDSRKFTLLCLAVAGIAAVLVVYSQTWSLTWDEGFHVLAAQLVNSGKRPYLDFLFAQTPLNVYWAAFIMSLFGETWHTAHALAALETSAAVLLAADYVFRRFPATEWRLPAALTTAALIGFNVSVVEFGTLGQAYGLCLFLTVLAFRCAVAAVERNSPLPAALAGLASGAAAGSSLLTVTVAPVLFIWLALANRAGSRLAKLAAFLAGAFISVIPLLRLFLLSPHQVMFDVVDFHLFYRQIQWDNWKVHDLEVITDWLNCTPALLLGALALAGVIFVRRAAWPRPVRNEFYLSAALALTGGVYLITAHPTFERYFLLITPFAAIPAAAGLHSLVKTARWPVALVILLTAGATARQIYDDHDDSWYRIEPIARKVAEVTPPGAPLYADEHVYFLLHRTPPEGLEWNGGHKVDLPMSQAAPLHLLPRRELVRQVQSGKFATVETCGQGEPATLGLAAIYRQKAEINDCFVFWDKRN